MDTEMRKKMNADTVVSRDRRKERTRKKSKPADPDIVYTQPKPFNRGRFLLRLATVVAVVLALILGLSIFFKVENIQVSGMEKYTAWDVRQASGISMGDNLLSLSKAKISGNIIAGLPYVGTVQVGITLPNTVNIHITELEVCYAIQASDDSWWLINSEGRIIEKTNASDAEDYTRVLGIRVENPVQGQPAVAEEQEPEPDENGFTVPVTVLGREYLQAAKTILSSMEANGIIGQMATVDVSNLGSIELWYGKQFQILLGDSSQLAYKVEAAKKAIDQMSQYQTGQLDVSFTIYPDQVIYTKFS